MANRVFVSTVQIDAARYKVKRDQARGKSTPVLVERIAQAVKVRHLTRLGA